jgi:putative transposase
VAKDSYFLEAGRYIERNPLRAKLVTELADYPWSSYRLYAAGTENPLVDEDPFYAPLGSTAYQRQEAYRAFVRIESPYAEVLDAKFLDEPF